MSFDRSKLKASVAQLHSRGILLGTSSWKYPGWRGQLYETDRYIFRGRLSESRFDRLCLSEYAEVFKTVCVDAAYYKFPDCRSLEALISQVPDDFLFTFKVTDEITIRQFPLLPRHGARAGKPNENFLNAELFRNSFLSPCERFRKNIGVLIFEFSRFHPDDFLRGHDFLEALEKFLAELPPGWQYGIEIRNRTFLQPEYFALLQKYRVTHVFSSWQDLPPLPDQIALAGDQLSADRLVARLLLRPGRKYEDAVRMFQPYARVQDPYPEGRSAAVQLIRKVLANVGKMRALMYVNNRFEGNALQTICAIIDELGPLPIAPPAGAAGA
jgi:uncharacterized protein YecE (DUF72 family)